MQLRFQLVWLGEEDAAEHTGDLRRVWPDVLGI